jgi:hypothetical protein
MPLPHIQVCPTKHSLDFYGLSNRMFMPAAIASDVLGGLILGQVSPIPFLYLKHLEATEHTRLPQQYIPWEWMISDHAVAPL